MAIKIHIRRLVVEGASRAEAEATAAAFQAELVQAIGSHGLPAQWREAGPGGQPASRAHIHPRPLAATPAGQGRQAARRLARP
jgi:hypothetical protein